MSPPTTESATATASWQALLRQAITTPGLIHEAYTRFHQYSLRNQLLVMCQCVEREIAPGPVATFETTARSGAACSCTRGHAARPSPGRSQTPGRQSSRYGLAQRSRHVAVPQSSLWLFTIAPNMPDEVE
jgi:hypothetical protein